ncbi:Carbamate kinase 1 [Koleobacter methoxysyntrophicus]|uniref:Carbamate kinase n=1 Tax=Koleobacter methoxysyntrophicus TaxID=2751313 RepID=A0A8A0RKZ1_9FIRM|nr:carbamate kinase [Koleobacter methoxysyntrophicus]QSQ09055.1 Carbamate kinase 1 [Koleobacter methoxysyntrophicus]
MGKTIVVALGGNAILQAGERGTAAEQKRNIENTVKQIVKLIKDNHRVIVTHGNGPQVGNLMIQQEAAKGKVPPMPLDVCGAQTQGQIGYMIQNSLENEFKRLGINKKAVTLITQVLVDKNDPAFANPTKPVGPFYTEEEARRAMEEKSEIWIEDSGRGWRRVVPSPDPKGIVERDIIKSLVERDFVVIASGGGGIPVIEDADGSLLGVEAVIDKDLAGEKLAHEVGADTFVILTDVPYVAINYGTPSQKNLEKVTLAEMEDYKKQGHFRAGSMGPKVEAVCRFVRRGGKMAVIASLDKAVDAVYGKTGTVIVNNTDKQLIEKAG